MLAQSTDLPSVPESTFKWVIIILIAIALVSAALYTAFWRNGVRIEDDPPLAFRKADKLYNHEAVSERFGRVESRLRDHDSEFARLRAERKEDEESANKRNMRVMFALGKIAEKLKVDIEPTD